MSRLLKVGAASCVCSFAVWIILGSGGKTHQRSGEYDPLQHHRRFHRVVVDDIRCVYWRRAGKGAYEFC